MKLLGQVKLITPDKLHVTWTTGDWRAAGNVEERAKNIDEYHVKAFEVLSVDGKIEEGTLKEALLHGTDAWPGSQGQGLKLAEQQSRTYSERFL
eukprot:s4950_g1.t1